MPPRVTHDGEKTVMDDPNSFLGRSSGPLKGTVMEITKIVCRHPSWDELQERESVRATACVVETSSRFGIRGCSFEIMGQNAMIAIGHDGTAHAASSAQSAADRELTRAAVLVVSEHLSRELSV